MLYGLPVAADEVQRLWREPGPLQRGVDGFCPALRQCGVEQRQPAHVGGVGLDLRREPLAEVVGVRERDEAQRLDLHVAA